MTLEVIYVTRHGFRSNWLVDHTNGSYSSTLRSPTGIAADPALTAHGVDQAKELGQRLIAADPPIERVYSSLYYRCLQTVEPFVRTTSSSASSSVREDAEKGTRHCQKQLLHVRGETGLGEWYGSAPFEHPVPASLATLETHFPSLLDRDYQPAVVPTRMGESVDELHDRLAVTLERLIAECDRDGIRAVLLCSHAAPIIALGRVLTGNMPKNVEVEDFRAFTCGLSVFRRRKRASSGTNGSETANVGTNASRTQTVVDSTTTASSSGGTNNTSNFLGNTSGTAKQTTKAGTDDLQGAESDPLQQGLHVPPLAWRGGRGVGGGWNCELNSDCSHLSQGEERGWRFSGDESFKDAPNKSMLDAGISLGVVVEGNKKSGNKSHGGRKSSTGGSHL